MAAVHRDQSHKLKLDMETVTTSNAIMRASGLRRAAHAALNRCQPARTFCMTTVSSISTFLFVFSSCFGSTCSPAAMRASILEISRKTFSYLRASFSSGSESFRLAGPLLSEGFEIAVPLRVAAVDEVRSDASLLASSIFLAFRSRYSALRFCGQVSAVCPMRSQTGQRERKKGFEQQAALWP